MEIKVSIDAVNPDFISALVLKTYTPLLNNPIHAQRYEEWNTLHIPSYIAATANFAISLQTDPGLYDEEDITEVFNCYAQMIETSMAMVTATIAAEADGKNVVGFYNNDTDKIKLEIMKGLTYLYYRNIPDVGEFADKYNFDNGDMVLIEAVSQPLFFFAMPTEFLHAFLNAINDVINRTNAFIKTADAAREAKISVMPFNKAGVAALESLNEYLAIIVTLGDACFFTNPLIMDEINNNETIEILATETEGTSPGDSVSNTTSVV